MGRLTTAFPVHPPPGAVALSLLGHGPDAEDAGEDAAPTALRRIGDVRDPAAVDAWLRTVVRNTARMRRCPSDMTDTQGAQMRPLLPVPAGWRPGRQAGRLLPPADTRRDPGQVHNGEGPGP